MRRNAREQLLREVEEEHVRGVPEVEKLEVVLPALDAEVDQVVVVLQQVVAVRLAERVGHHRHVLHVGQARNLQRLELADGGLHLHLPLRLECVPVLVVVAGALHEMRHPAADLLGILDRHRRNVDVSIDQVKWFRLRTDAKSLENKNVTTKQGDLASDNSAKATVSDFSAGPQPFSVIPTDDRLYGEFRSRIDDKAIMNKLQNKNIYEIKLSNKGGLVMPVIIQWIYKDGTKEIERIPAEIWRINEVTVTKVFVKEKEVVSIVLDPLKETSDVGLSDNVFPRIKVESKFDQFKSKN